MVGRMLRLFKPTPIVIQDWLERKALIEEIKSAHTNWVIAQQKLDYVVDPEQIDYVVYTIEAAEKRYEMLIRQAKKMKLNIIEVQSEGRFSQLGG